MTLGTGIFLSSVFLGTVWLYAATKARWNWRKLMLRGAGGIVSLAIVVATISYGIIQFNNRPQQQTSFGGVSLGDTESDVLFRMGNPGSEKASRSSLKVLQYEPYSVVLKDGRVVRIDALIDDPGNWITLQGINRNSTRETIVDKFGPPPFEAKSTDHFSRLLSYPEYNLFFSLTRNRVTWLGVYEGDKSVLSTLEPVTDNDSQSK